MARGSPTTTPMSLRWTKRLRRRSVQMDRMIVGEGTSLRTGRLSMDANRDMTSHSVSCSHARQDVELGFLCRVLRDADQLEKGLLEPP